MSSPAQKLLADLSGAFGEEAVRAAVNTFQGAGGSMTPLVVAKCLGAVMASYKHALLVALTSCFGSWDCSFARDVLLGVEFEFERSGVAEALIPFVSDLDKFEQVVIMEGCPGLASYAKASIMEQVRAEQARRSGQNADDIPTSAASGANNYADGSAMSIPPTTSSHQTGTENVINAQIDGSQVPVAQSPVSMPVGMNQNSIGAAPVLAPVGNLSFTGQHQVPQATATAMPMTTATPVAVQMSLGGTQFQQRQLQQQQQQQVCVQIPHGIPPGGIIQARAPNGQTFSVRVPPNAPGGSTIMVIPPAPTQNLIQPARMNMINGSSASANAVLRRRQLGSQRRRQIMRIAAAVFFFVIVGQIIGVIFRVSDSGNSEHDEFYSCTHDADPSCVNSNLETDCSINTCKNKCSQCN